MAEASKQGLSEIDEADRARVIAEWGLQLDTYPDLTEEERARSIAVAEAWWPADPVRYRLLDVAERARVSAVLNAELEPYKAEPPEGVPGAFLLVRGREGTMTYAPPQPGSDGRCPLCGKVPASEAARQWVAETREWFPCPWCGGAL